MKTKKILAFVLRNTAAVPRSQADSVVPMQIKGCPSGQPFSIAPVL